MQLYQNIKQKLNPRWRRLTIYMLLVELRQACGLRVQNTRAYKRHIVSITRISVTIFSIFNVAAFVTSSIGLPTHRVR